MQGREDILDWLTLVALPGPGCVLTHRLLAAFGSAADVLAAGRKIAEISGIGTKLLDVFTSPARRDKARCWAEKEYKRVRAKNIRLLCCDDPYYPASLLNIHNYPILLYCLGDLSCLRHPTVAVVGSRTPTAYGKNVAEELSGQLAKNGLAVVSGLAKGIDSRAHLGSLAAGGKTIAVLGCGVDVVYPGENAALYRRITEQGLLVTEYPLGTPPEGFRFPERNRVISGLASGVVVVEAGARSGALITARHALDQNREVFAVPGRIDSLMSEGPLSLLRQGATLVRDVKDILAELPPSPLCNTRLSPARNIPSTSPGSVVRRKNTLPDDLSRGEKKLLAAMKEPATDIEELSESMALPIGTLHGLLLGLELRGLIQQLPGQQYART